MLNKFLILFLCITDFNKTFFIMNGSLINISLFHTFCLIASVKPHQCKQKYILSQIIIVNKIDLFLFLQPKKNLFFDIDFEYEETLLKRKKI